MRLLARKLDLDYERAGYRAMAEETAPCSFYDFVRLATR